MQDAAVSKSDNRLLLGILVPFYHHDGQLYQERQACNGLRLWADNFDFLDVMAVKEPGPPPRAWVPVEEIGPARDRMRFHTFPPAYTPNRFLRQLPVQRPRIRALIKRATHLNFATGGTWGDWGAVGIFEAKRMGRKSSMWTDQISSQVMWRSRRDSSFKRHLLTVASYLPMVWMEREVARRSDLGLFHGKDTYVRYSAHSPQPELVHNIHLSPSRHITPSVLAQKCATAHQSPLRIVYLGRTIPIKGPFDWLRALEILHAKGIDFTATWIGEGSELENMRAHVARAGLADRITLPGFTDDRDKLFQALQEAHLHMFCHKTPESPRNLIEALVSGCPIVGYSSSYSEDLISEHGGGVLTPPNAPEAVADAVAKLATDRPRLRDLIARSARDGAPFDEDKVFAHRCELIKKYA